MKKLFFLGCALLMMAQTTWAAWQPDDKKIIPLDGDRITDDDVKVMRTSDGSFVHTWIYPDTATVSGEKRDIMAIQMQVYSKDGVPSFGEHGLRLVNQPTPKDDFGYSIVEASNGDLLLAYSDTRTVSAEERQRELYVYRFKKDGTPVWAATGVKVPIKHAHTTGVLYAIEMQPTLCVSGDNIYLYTYYEEYYKEGDKNLAYDDMQMFGINPSDGSALWSVAEKLRMIHLEPCENGDAYMLFSADDGKMFGNRIDKNGASVWSAPVEIGGVVGMGTILPAEPNCALDEDGNLMLGYYVYPGESSLIRQQVMNRLTKDGKVLSAPVCGDKVSVGYVQDKTASAARGNSMFLAWSWYHPGSGDDTKYIHANAFNTDGSYSWSTIGQNAVVLCEHQGDDDKPVGVVPQDNGWVVVYFEGTKLYQGNLHVTKLSDAGEVMWTKQLGKDSIDFNTVSMTYDDKNAYIVYSSWNGVKGMFGICTDITDEHNLPSSVATVPEERKGTMKVMRNGMLYIIREGKTYNAQGAIVE